MSVFILAGKCKILLLYWSFIIIYAFLNLIIQQPWVLVTPCAIFIMSCRNHLFSHLECPSPTPRVHTDSRPSSQWCYPAISSSVVPFSSCLQSLPISESFPMSQHFTWGGQSTAVSASASVLPMNTQNWSPLGWTGCISLQSKRLNSLLQHHSSKASVLRHSAFFIVQLSHPYMTTGKR